MVKILMAVHERRESETCVQAMGKQGRAGQLRRVSRGSTMLTSCLQYLASCLSFHPFTHLCSYCIFIRILWEGGPLQK